MIMIDDEDNEDDYIPSSAGDPILPRDIEYSSTIGNISLGDNNTYGSGIIVSGDNNIVSGNNSVVSGTNITSNSNNSMVVGTDILADGNNNIISGSDIFISAPINGISVFGASISITEPVYNAFIIGNNIAITATGGYDNQLFVNLPSVFYGTMSVNNIEIVGGATFSSRVIFNDGIEVYGSTSSLYNKLFLDTNAISISDIHSHGDSIFQSPFTIDGLHGSADGGGEGHGILIQNISATVSGGGTSKGFSLRNISGDSGIMIEDISGIGRGINILHIDGAAAEGILYFDINGSSDGISYDDIFGGNNGIRYSNITGGSNGIKYDNSVKNVNFGCTVSFNNNIEINSVVKDILGNTGPDGYILSATAGGVQWIPNIVAASFSNNYSVLNTYQSPFVAGPYNSSGPTASGGGGLTTLATFSVPTNLLFNNNDRIDFEIGGLIVRELGATDQSIALRFGTSSTFLTNIGMPSISFNGTTGIGGEDSYFVFKGTIMRYGATQASSQSTGISTFTNGATPNSQAKVTRTPSSLVEVDFSNEQFIRIEGQSTGTSATYIQMNSYCFNLIKS